MKKRTTMTIDADNARRLARLQKERDLSWKEAVNTVIRRLGISSDTFLRLFSRAPRILICVFRRAGPQDS